MTGNCLIGFTAIVCCEFFMVGALFSVENPTRSYLWVLPPMMMVQRLVGAAFCIFTMRQFRAAYIKETAMLHKFLNFHELANTWTIAADVKLPLRVQILYEGEWRFMTSLACGYPPQLGVKMGQLIAEDFQVRKQFEQRHMTETHT